MEQRLRAATPVVALGPAGSAIGTVTTDAAASLPRWVDYVSALGPLIVLAGAVVGAVLAWSATRRDRWWARTQWAVDHVVGGDPDAQVVALAVLEVQVRHARSAEEAGVVGAVSDTLLGPLLARTSPDARPGPAGEAGATRYVVRPTAPRATALSQPPQSPPARGTGSTGPSRLPPSSPQDRPAERSGVAGVVPVSPVERDAARLRAQVDAKLGRPSTAAVTQVARASTD